MEKTISDILHRELTFPPQNLRFRYTPSGKPSPVREQNRFDLGFNISHREVAARCTLSHLQQMDVYFNCWSRKEGYIKPRGEGLSHRLNQFAVSLTPGEPAALLHTDADPQETNGWSLFDLRVDPGYNAAFAVYDKCSLIRYCQWVD